MNSSGWIRSYMAKRYSGEGFLFVQPESALTAIRVILAVIPAIAFIIAILFTWKLDVTKERFDTIVHELEKRNKLRDNEEQHKIN